jgi:hypothetical protein
MLTLFDTLRTRPFAYRAAAMLAYGMLTFLAIFYLGFVLFDNILIFHVFEIAWFIHILFIASKIHQGQRELFVLALLGLSPGIVRNLADLFSL